MKKIKVYLALPSLGTRHDGQIYFLEHIKKEYADHIEFVYPKDCVQIVFHDASRNHYVEEFLKTDCDVIWFMDADILPFMNFMQYFTEYYNQWEVAAGICPIWMSPERNNPDSPRKVVYNIYKDHGKGFVPHSVKNDVQEYVDGAGTGSMLIKRHVFDSLKKPYFFFTFEEETRNHTGGEDLNFCRKLQEAKIPIFVNTNALCRHFKSVDLHEVAEYALRVSEDAVNAYRQQFLTQMSKLRKPNSPAVAIPTVNPGERRTDSGLIIAPK